MATAKSDERRRAMCDISGSAVVLVLVQTIVDDALLTN